VHDKPWTGYNQVSFSHTYRTLVKHFDVESFMGSWFI